MSYGTKGPALTELQQRLWTHNMARLKHQKAFGAEPYKSLGSRARVRIPDLTGAPVNASDGIPLSVILAKKEISR